MRNRYYVLSGAVVVAGLATVALSQRTPAPQLHRPEATGKSVSRVAHPRPKPRRPTPARTRPPIQAPKAGSTTTIIRHHGGTETITRTTVIGQTDTSTLAAPPTTPGIPGQVAYRAGLSFFSTGSLPAAAFAALWTARHETPPRLAAPIQSVMVPWAHSTTWAVVPVGLPDPAQGGAILWAGVSSQRDQWMWIPDDVAAAVNPALPRPLGQTLQWAEDLALNAPGPANLLGMHSWASVTGQVQAPAGWSVQAIGPTLITTVWDPSTHYTPLYFAPEGIWSAENATTGHHALSQIVAAAVPLPKAVAPPPTPYK